MSLGDAWRANQDLNVTYGVRIDASRFGRARNSIRRAAGVRPAERSRAEPDLVQPARWLLKRSAKRRRSPSAKDSRAGRAQRIAGGHRRVPGIAGAIAHESSDLEHRSAERGAAADVRRRRDADSGLGAVSRRSVERAERVRRRHGRECVREPQPGVTLVDPDYQASRRISADLNWNGWVLRNRFNLQRRRQLCAQPRPAGRDRPQLRADARFTLADEGGRPVFVQPTSIVPTTGSIASRDARVSQIFSRVTLHQLGSAVGLQADRRSVSRRRHSTRRSPGTRATRAPGTRRLVQGFQSTVGNPLDREWGDNDINASTRSSSTSITICSTRSG